MTKLAERVKTSAITRKSEQFRSAVDAITAVIYSNCVHTSECNIDFDTLTVMYGTIGDEVKKRLKDYFTSEGFEVALGYNNSYIRIRW